MNTAERIVNWAKWRDWKNGKTALFGEILIVDAIRFEKELNMATQKWSDAERYKALREMAFLPEERQETVAAQMQHIDEVETAEQFDAWCDSLIVALLPPFNAREVPPEN